MGYFTLVSKAKLAFILALLLPVPVANAAPVSVSSFTCTAVLPENPRTASDYLVTKLPDLPASALSELRTHYAGFIPTSTNSSNPGNLFFWYFPSSNTASADLVIWLNGGPGCSSLFGSFVENGPLEIQNNGTLAANLNSWHRHTNILYIEQPSGAGFSTNLDPTKGPFDEFQVASLFLTFLNGFYFVFPEAKSWSLHLTGESYAGVYIPFICAAITQCPYLVDQKTPILLSGIAINNAVLDFDRQIAPSSAVAAYDYLANRNFFAVDPTGLLQETAAKTASICRSLKTKNESLAMDEYGCNMVGLVGFWFATHMNSLGKGNTCLNPYNVDSPIPCGALDEFHLQEDALLAYLNNPAVRDAIHVDPYLSTMDPSRTWEECHRTTITTQHDSEHGPSPITFLPMLIERGIKVIIYNGDSDLLVNYVAQEQAFGNMTWNGSKGFQNDPTQWTVNSLPAGLKWVERGLSYIRVFGAGHMVVANDPAAGLQVLSELLNINVNEPETKTPAQSNVLYNGNVSAGTSLGGHRKFEIFDEWWTFGRDAVNLRIANISIPQLQNRSIMEQHKCMYKRSSTGATVKVWF
ncbi:Cell death protease [Chytriomyces hyalinus]|nr:Cell death protease [Chytriomyces hyalinus]